jgi:DNA-binding transcriptional regulator YiaG
MRVFGLPQKGFAERLGVHQSTVHRWETKGGVSIEMQAKIRDLAKQDGKAWSDSWFFEVPDQAA